MEEKMKGMTPAALAKVCQGEYFGPEEQGNTEISCLVTDNRQLQPGGMFVAIKGEKVDGNRFVPSSYEAGALCCMSEDAPVDDTKPYIRVADCLQALKDMAAYYRKQYPVTVIGVTGSVGKTSTKEMLASVLSEHFTTLKTQGNFNNEVGVPLTLFRLRQEHEVAIVEMGISDFGEMSRLTNIAKPDLCVITNIGQCHLEQLKDRDGVLRAKTEIFEGLSQQGTAYLNGDDDKLAAVSQVHGRSPYFFGLGQHNRICPQNIVSKGLLGSEFDIVSEQGVFHVNVNVPGKHMITNALATAAVGLDLGLTFEEITRGIAAFRPVDGHSSMLVTENFTIMDDCYNANPVSMRAGIDVLCAVPERKVAILGDMFELGEQEEKMHFEIGQYLADKQIDCIIAIGTLAKQYEKGVKSLSPSQKIYYYETKEDAIKDFNDILCKGDAIFVKASHGMHFEVIVEHLKTR